jgi:hypothetical protein
MPGNLAVLPVEHKGRSEPVDIGCLTFQAGKVSPRAGRSNAAKTVCEGVNACCKNENCTRPDLG